jgi:hypothetical protein
MKFARQSTDENNLTPTEFPNYGRAIFIVPCALHIQIRSYFLCGIP